MLKALTDLFDHAFRADRSDEAAAGDRRHAVRVATALLLVEVERADFAENVTERRQTFELLKTFFELTDEEAALLVEEARAEADHAASLQGFTRRLHEALTNEKKLGVVEMLWKVAMADAHLDKHEEHLVRKIADLLYVSHSDFVRLRNAAKAEAAGR